MWKLVKNVVLLLVVYANWLLCVESLQWRFVNNEDALCNDFTQAGYYLHNAPSSQNWVVFLEGGGACFSAETCNRRYVNRETRLQYGGGEITQPFNVTRAWNENSLNRQNIVSPLMTSIYNLTNGQDASITGTDILSTNCAFNPDFCDYNHILIPYCSSDFWLGNDTRYNTSGNNDFEFVPDATDMQFIFKGFVIFQSVVRETIPTNTTGTVLVAGSSSGGIGALNQAKWVKEYLPAADIRILTDSAWFVNFHDNLYSTFTDFTNISEDSMRADFNITEYVLSQRQVSLYTLLLHHEPCSSIELGPPCCISPYCLIANPNYYPRDVPVLAVFSLYDAYLLGPSLIGIELYNAQETSFEVNFESKDETEPVGLNFNFLRIIGEYGGVMNNTLDITSHQSYHLSYYVTSCLQHVYLATSSLWGEDGLFGSDTYEFSNDASLIRHTVEQGRWINFMLTQLFISSDDLEHNVSVRDAIGIWLNTANSTNPVRFREACHVTHCNELCPEEIRVEQDDSFLWEEQAELLVYCFVVTMTFICFAIKGIFSYWHCMLLRKQNQFLQRAKDIETRNAIYQFPECEYKISIACLDLHYSVPFNHKKQKSDYDVMPMVLPNPEDDNIDESDNEDGDLFDVYEEVAVKTEETAIPDSTTMRGYHKDDSDKENTDSLHSNFPLLMDDSEALPFPKIGSVVKKFFEDDVKKTANCENRIPEQKEKVKVILNGISLYFNPGQLVAIMGPSGSGKTTFLDLITGRRKYGNTTGSIFINGHRLDDIRDWYIANTGYVLQLASPYYEELTVRENLALAAQMRLSFSMREKFERIEQVMNETGLQELADIVVGGTVGPGLSGGQKKRLTIALQLLRLPSVIFLDEPTSGLDSASSYELLMHLNRLAGSQRTVIMTIHQPRMEIFHMFTRLIMLCEGKVAYHGSPFKAYEVFITALKAQYLEKGLVLPLLEDQNPADVIMDMLGNSKMREAILQYYEESGDPQAIFEAIKQSQETEDDIVDEGLAHFMFGNRRILQDQGSTFVRMAALEARASLRTSFSQLAYLPVIFFFYGFLLGTVYIQTTSAVLIVSGFCVYSVASALFMFPIMHNYYSQALLLYRLEHSDGIGHAIDLVIQGFTRFVFLGLIPVAMCAGILYLLVIMVSSYNLEVYLKVLVVNMALNQTWIALLMFILCAFPSVAFRLSPVISSVAGFTSGFFIPRDSMPPWYRWLFFINPNYYGFSSTAYLLLKEFDSNCAGNELECYVSTGDYTLTQFNFNEANPALHVMILFLMTICYLILAFVAMKIRHSNKCFIFRRLHGVFSRDRVTDLEKWSLPHTDSMHPVNGDKQHVEIELGEFRTNNSGTGDAKDDDRLHFELDKPQLGVTSPSKNVLARRKSSNESHYSIVSNDDQEIRANTKMEMKEDEHSPQHCTTINDNDLNDSQIQLEKLLFPPTTSDSDSSESSGKHKDLSNVPAGNAVKINPFVRVHSSGEVLDSSRSVRFGQQEDSFDKESNFRAPTGQSRMIYAQKQQSNFLDENERHEIWKPNKAKTRRLSLPVQPIQSLSPSPQTLHPSSYDQQDETTSPSDSRSPSPIMTSKDLRLRQQQLLERIALAREASKDQNNTLLSHINDHDTPYSKFQNLVNAALAQKQFPLTCPENAKLKWKKAVILSRDTSNIVRPLTAVKLASKQQLIKRASKDQGSTEKPFLGTTPQSKSEFQLPSSSPSKIHTLQGHVTYASINTRPPFEDFSEGKTKLINQVSLHNTDTASMNKIAAQSIQEEAGISVDIINNSSNDDLGSDSDAADLDECNSSTGCSWSGYDTTSTTVTCTPISDDVNRTSHVKFTRSTSRNAGQCSPVAKHFSAFHSRKSQLSDNLSPPSIEVVDKLPTNYQPYSHSANSGISSSSMVNRKTRSRSAASKFYNPKSSQIIADSNNTEVKVTEDHFKMATNSHRNIHHLIVSATSVLPQVDNSTPPSPSEDKTQTAYFPHMSNEVTSMYAGQKEHRHNEKVTTPQ